VVAAAGLVLGPLRERVVDPEQLQRLDRDADAGLDATAGQATALPAG
jgi:hypothetical protein